MSNLSLHLDRPNEIVLKVEITSTEPQSGETPEINLVCEGKELSYSFKGKYNSEGEVEIKIPTMKGKLTEGTYASKLEVVLGDKYFCPLNVDLKFVESMKVVAEFIQRPEKKKDDMVKAAIIKKPVIPETKKITEIPKKKMSKTTTLKDRFGKR